MLSLYAQVCTDIVHIADRALTYYDFGFSEFQKARPEIVAGLPSPEKTVLEAAAAMNSLNLSKANDAPAKAASSNNLEAMDNGAPNGDRPSHPVCPSIKLESSRVVRFACE